MSMIKKDNSIKKYRKAKAAAETVLSPEAEKILAETREKVAARKAAEAEEAEAEAKEAEAKAPEAQPEEKSEEPKAAPDSGHKVVEDPAPQPVEQTSETPAVPAAPETQPEAGKHNPAPHIQSAVVKPAHPCPADTLSGEAHYSFGNAEEAKAMYDEFRKDVEHGLIDTPDGMLDSGGHRLHLYQPFWCCWPDGSRVDYQFKRLMLGQIAEDEALWRMAFIGYEDAGGIHDASNDPDAQRVHYLMSREIDRIRRESVRCPWRNNGRKKK